MPLIPALGRQRKADLYEFEVSLVYKVSSRTVTQRNPVLKSQIYTVSIYTVVVMLASQSDRYCTSPPI